MKIWVTLTDGSVGYAGEVEARTVADLTGAEADRILALRRGHAGITLRAEDNRVVWRWTAEESAAAHPAVAEKAKGVS